MCYRSEWKKFDLANLGSGNGLCFFYLPDVTVSRISLFSNSHVYYKMRTFSQWIEKIRSSVCESVSQQKNRDSKYIAMI